MPIIRRVAFAGLAMLMAGAAHSQTAPSPAAADDDIVAVAEANGQFETLLQAAEAAGLSETLSGEGPYTLFAPTDEAFAALPAGLLEGLLEPASRDQLRALLSYHVVEGELDAAALADATDAESLQGEDLRFDAAAGSVRVNEATVGESDIAASNGVIHVIDRVLMPSGMATGAVQGGASGGVLDAPNAAPGETMGGGTAAGDAEPRGTGAMVRPRDIMAPERR